MSATITPTEFAEVVGSDGRTVRKFLRSVTPREEHPGKGSRWSLPGTKRDVSALQKRFNKWNAEQAELRAQRAAEAAEKAAAEVETDEDEVLDDE